MHLYTKSIYIFLALVFFIALPAMFPTPGIIFISVLLGTALVLFQTYIILKDEESYPYED